MRGRVERIGNATLYHGDCRDILLGLRYDVLVTDPPYGIERARGGTINNPKGKGAYGGAFVDDQASLNALIAEAIAPAIRAAKRAAITPGRLNVASYPRADDVGMFYHPAATSMSFWGRATWQPILFYGRDPRIGKTIQPLHLTVTERPAKVDHPCPKPLGGWRWLMDRAALPGETVCDPFVGSGTGGIVAAALGLPFIGIELDERWFDMSCERIEEAQRQGKLFGEAA